MLSEGLRPAQVEAVNGIEHALAEQRFARSLVQMATGARKTFTAVTESYRLLKHGGFRRILFLVDRSNLGDQTQREFQQACIQVRRVCHTPHSASSAFQKRGRSPR